MPQPITAWEQEAVRCLAYLASERGCRLPPSSRTWDAVLLTDVWPDPVSQYELFLALERRYTVAFPDALVSTVESVGDLAYWLGVKIGHGPERE